MGYSDEHLWNLTMYPGKIAIPLGMLGFPLGYLLYVAKERSWVIANSLSLYERVFAVFAAQGYGDFVVER
jgi:hypothetical protein